MPSLVSMSIKVSMLKRSIRPRMRSAMPGEIEVILRCPSRPLLERVKNVDRLGELGDVEDAVLCTRVDADLLDARPDARHRFPIVRLQAALHSPGAGIRRSAWRRLESGPLYKNLDVASTPDRKSTRLNSSHGYISYAVFCLKKKK